METMTTESHVNSETRVTTHYWGYRELSENELLNVGGGDVGDYADGGDRGYDSGSCDAAADASCNSVGVNLASQIDRSMTDPVMALAMFFGLVVNGAPAPSGPPGSPGGNIGIGAGEFTGNWGQ